MHVHAVCIHHNVRISRQNLRVRKHAAMHYHVFLKSAGTQVNVQAAVGKAKKKITGRIYRLGFTFHQFLKEKSKHICHGCPMNKCSRTNIAKFIIQYMVCFHEGSLTHVKCQPYRCTLTTPIFGDRLSKWKST